jgi:hypothetical protein
MNQIWIIVAVLVVLVLVMRIRARRQGARFQRPLAAGPRIQGYQVVAFVHPRMSAACLFDHGLQFGRGFRRKEGPQLPHDGECRCESVAFSFSSSEVFNGALRAVGQARSTIDGLQADDIARLLERLKAVEVHALPPDAAAYAQAVGAGDFPPAVQAPLRAFLAERHAYLQQHPPAVQAGGEARPPHRLETPEPK